MYKKLMIPALLAASLSSIAVAQDRAAQDKTHGDATQRASTPASDQYRPDDFPGSNNHSNGAQGGAAAAKSAGGNAYLPDDFPGSNNHSTAPRGTAANTTANGGGAYRPDDFPGSNNRGPAYRPGRPQKKKDRGAGPEHDLRKGSHLPAAYRDPQYVVQDWRHAHLSKPKRGYQWVKTGDDYLLVATSTGVISTVWLGQ